jgi:redox-sensitive bicupin YhaK (pirin superfamily)
MTGTGPDEPGYLELGPLRLCALEDVDAGGGFALHEHRDTEIVTLPLRGRFVHEDSMGQLGTFEADHVGVFSAGAGAQHAERALEPVRVVQLWFEPRKRGAAPRFWLAKFPRAARRNCWATVASGRLRPGERALPIDQDVEVRVCELTAGVRLSVCPAPGRLAYLLVVDSATRVERTRLLPGERAIVPGGVRVELQAENDTDLVWLDLPAA